MAVSILISPKGPVQLIGADNLVFLTFTFLAHPSFLNEIQVLLFGCDSSSLKCTYSCILTRDRPCRFFCFLLYQESLGYSMERGEYLSEGDEEVEEWVVRGGDDLTFLWPVTETLITLQNKYDILS